VPSAVLFGCLLLGDKDVIVAVLSALYSLMSVALTPDES